jgi:hypothetical protein
VEYPLNEAMQSTLAVLTKVRPEDLDAPTPCASWDVRALVNHFVGTALASALLGQARLAISDAFRGQDGQAPFGPFGPAVAVPDGAGPADQLAGFLGRPV